MTPVFSTAAVLGGGAVGQVFAEALRSAGSRVVLLWNRSEQSGWETELERVRDAAIVFLTVSDPAVEPLCGRIAGLVGRGQLVVHCAGALSLDVLSSALQAGARTGSLHPLRAIPRGSGATVLRDAAAGVAASDATARAGLDALARSLGMSPIPVSNDARPLYHAAAVLAAAGQVALFSRAVKAFQDATGAPEPLARSALLPLAQGALAALEQRDPADALTGPVARGDAATVAAHRNALDEQTLRLYDELTRAMLVLRPSGGIEAVLRTRPAATRSAEDRGSRSSLPHPPPPPAARPSASSRSPARRGPRRGRPRRGRAPRRKR